MVVRPVVPWFTDDLKKLKAERRKCERKMLQSGCSSDREIYYRTRDKYSACLRKTKISYYSDLIDECSGNSKKLFCVFNSLTKQKSSESLPPHDDPLILANEFGSFFGRKIELINEEIDKLDVMPINVEHCSPEVLFKAFSSLSQDEIRRLILNAPNVSCQLDPIPTYLLKNCCNVLCPIITKLVNMSLEEGRVPENWKLALLKPLLKKAGMDLVLENFRPVNNLPFVAKVTKKVLLEFLKAAAWVLFYFYFTCLDFLKLSLNICLVIMLLQTMHNYIFLLNLRTLCIRSQQLKQWKIVLTIFATG